MDKETTTHGTELVDEKVCRRETKSKETQHQTRKQYPSLSNNFEETSQVVKSVDNGRALFVKGMMLSLFGLLVFFWRKMKTSSQPRKIQFLRTFGVGPFFFFSGLINANAIFQWSTGDGR